MWVQTVLTVWIEGIRKCGFLLPRKLPSSASV